MGGVVGLSTTDYPDRLSAVVFCQGCSWRCDYCHNPHLQPGRSATQMHWDAVSAFLLRRLGLLDAVVFSGGEPTQQPALAHAMRAVKAMGFQVGLHTAGIHPRRLAAVLPLVDWVGMDVKAPFADYDRITRARGSGERARASAVEILASGTEYEFRTTVDTSLLAPGDLVRIADDLDALGARRYALQQCRARHSDGSAAYAIPPDIRGQLAVRFDDFFVRSA